MFTFINMSRDHITSYFRQHGVDLLLLEKVPCKKLPINGIRYSKLSTNRHFKSYIGKQELSLSEMIKIIRWLSRN